MIELADKYSDVFIQKEKFSERKFIKNEAYQSSFQIINTVLNQYKDKAKSRNEVEMNQASERALKNIDDMLLTLHKDAKSPHNKATQYLFYVLLNEPELFKVFKEVADQSTIYLGKSPTLFADNRKPPVLGTIITATKSVFEKFHSGSISEDDVGEWKKITGFDSLFDDGKAIVLRSIVEDFTNIEYKKTITFFKKMGGNPYYNITDRFDRAETTPHQKTSPFASAPQKKEVQLINWVYDHISSKSKNPDNKDQTGVKRVFKMTK
jgi:hypothetical protein